jgi:hypothetical protein
MSIGLFSLYGGEEDVVYYRTYYRHRSMGLVTPLTTPQKGIIRIQLAAKITLVQGVRVWGCN